MDKKQLAKLVNKLASINTADWRSVVLRMSWVYRQPFSLQITPRQLVKHLGIPVELPEEQWITIRAEVSRVRRTAARRAKLKKAQDMLAQRRNYMRDYMRRRRELRG